MWGVRTKVIPIVVGALGIVPLRLKENLRTIGVDKSIELIQRCVLLGSARILRKVLERAKGSKVKRRTLLGFPRQLVVARSQWKPDLTPFSESIRVFSESGRSPGTNEERADEIMYTTDPGYHQNTWSTEDHTTWNISHPKKGTLHHVVYGIK